MRLGSESAAEAAERRHNARATVRRRSISTTSSSAPARPAACSPIGSPRRAATACCCSRPAARIAISGSTSRSATASCSTMPRSIGSTRPSRSRSSTTAGSSSRAARCWADRARSTACFMSAASTRITITGASSAIPAGALPTCCLISGAPRIRQRGADDLHGAAVRSRCRTSASRIRCAKRSSRRRNRRGIPRNDDFNGPTPGRRRLFPAHHQERPALVDRGRLSAAGADAAQSARSCSTRWRAASSFSGRRAIGVEYRQGQATHTAYADGEVIVCRRRLQLAATVAALRPRPGGDVASSSASR